MSYDPKKLEVMECLNKMWAAFIRVAKPEEDKGTIERFIDAKDRVHQLLSEMANEEELWKVGYIQSANSSFLNRKIGVS